MSLRNFPTELAYLVLGIFIVNTAAVFWGWYYIVPSIDIPLHLAGGFWVGGSGMWGYYAFSKKISKKLSVTIVGSMLIAIVIGALWEGFEFYTNLLLAREPFSALDTMGDMICDIIGGVCAGWYISRKP